MVLKGAKMKECMTVGEIIEALSKYDKQINVKVYSTHFHPCKDGNRAVRYLSDLKNIIGGGHSGDENSNEGVECVYFYAAEIEENNN